MIAFLLVQACVEFSPQQVSWNESLYACGVNNLPILRHENYSIFDHIECSNDMVYSCNGDVYSLSYSHLFLSKMDFPGLTHSVWTGINQSLDYVEGGYANGLQFPYSGVSLDGNRHVLCLMNPTSSPVTVPTSISTTLEPTQSPTSETFVPTTISPVPTSESTTPTSVPTVSPVSMNESTLAPTINETAIFTVSATSYTGYIVGGTMGLAFAGFVFYIRRNPRKLSELKRRLSRVEDKDKIVTYVQQNGAENRIPAGSMYKHEEERKAGTFTYSKPPERGTQGNIVTFVL